MRNITSLTRHECMAEVADWIAKLLDAIEAELATDTPEQSA